MTGYGLVRLRRGQAESMSHGMPSRSASSSNQHGPVEPRLHRGASSPVRAGRGRRTGPHSSPRSLARPLVGGRCAVGVTGDRRRGGRRRGASTRTSSRLERSWRQGGCSGQRGGTCRRPRPSGGTDAWSTRRSRSIRVGRCRAYRRGQARGDSVKQRRRVIAEPSSRPELESVDVDFGTFGLRSQDNVWLTIEDTPPARALLMCSA